jgi:hypothetical protein
VESRNLALIHLPARARAADEVEHLAWLYSRKAVALPLVVQSRHEAFEDIQRRQAAHAAAVERQQAEAAGIERVGLAAMLGREALCHRGVLWLDVLVGCRACRVRSTADA